MTPLAAWMAKQLTLPKRDRDEEFACFDTSVVSKALCDIHCFEVSQVLSLLPDIGQQMKKLDDDSKETMIGKFAFLPAPKTWLEYINPIAGRLGYLLEEQPGDPPRATVDLLYKGGATRLGIISTCSADYKTINGEVWVPAPLSEMYGDNAIDALIAFPHFALLLINSPRIIGRKQVMPNVALERRLIKTFGIGKFPLHAWTEIVLRVAKPPEIDDGLPHEAHLTGTRALHFVRKHIRIRLGRLEYVSAHWRGDAALGIKQSRYTVTA